MQPNDETYILYGILFLFLFLGLLFIFQKSSVPLKTSRRLKIRRMSES